MAVFMWKTTVPGHDNDGIGFENKRICCVCCRILFTNLPMHMEGRLLSQRLYSGLLFRSIQTHRHKYKLNLSPEHPSYKTNIASKITFQGTSEILVSYLWVE
jgi:hypothetical protein